MRWHGSDTDAYPIVDHFADTLNAGVPGDPRGWLLTVVVPRR
jgi:hypothetical protein